MSLVLTAVTILKYIENKHSVYHLIRFNAADFMKYEAAIFYLYNFPAWKSKHFIFCTSNFSTYTLFMLLA